MQQAAYAYITKTCFLVLGSKAKIKGFIKEVVIIQNLIINSENVQIIYDSTVQSVSDTFP